jgi:hypothetical protein
MPYNPEDMAPLEVSLLGVLCLGLPPSRAAGSDTFRVDHVTAVVAALQAGEQRDTNLGPDGVHITAEFGARLRETIDGLVEKGLVVHASGGMPAAAGGYEAGLELDLVNPDEHPAVLDRYLAQACMEQLFRVAAVYPFLMERYSASGEVWRKLREGGYAR